MVLYLYAVREVDTIYVVLAWLFVLFRVLHSLVHCTFNKIILRFALYAASCAFLFIMIIRAAVSWVM